MKIIETRPREIGFVLWDHCQNLLDDPRICHNDNDPRHEVCSDLVDNPEDRFAHDAAHIHQRFFTICTTSLYIGKGFTINTTLVVIL